MVVSPRVGYFCTLTKRNIDRKHQKAENWKLRSARSDDVVTRVNRGGGDFGENITGNPLLEVAPATSTQLFILVTVHVYFDPRSELSNLIYTAFI